MLYMWRQNPASQGGRYLANALHIPLIKHDSSKFQGKGEKIVINWGSSAIPEEVAKCKVINRPQAIAVAVNKLSTYNLLESVGGPCPEFTTDKEEAKEWFDEKGKRQVVCRAVLNGAGGAGITIATCPEELVDAPLYTLYMPKKNEYRVHVFMSAHDRGNLVGLYVQRKFLRPGFENPNWQVRNFENGFSYEHAGESEVPPNVLDDAIEAVKVMGLDFGAVDIGYNEKRSAPCIYEVNTAPGIEGQSVAAYAKHLTRRAMMMGWRPAKGQELPKEEAPAYAHYEPGMLGGEGQLRVNIENNTGINWNIPATPRQTLNVDMEAFMELGRAQLAGERGEQLRAILERPAARRATRNPDETF